MRGATTVDADEPNQIGESVAELVSELVQRNGLDSDEIVAAFFTTTSDLDSRFPAEAAREAGWANVPMLGAVEMSQPDAPVQCIRVLVLANTHVRRTVQHVYLRGAQGLRPDHAVSMERDEREVES